MSFPPAQDPHSSTPPGSGGGFGPPQGFGPPEQPGPPQGFGPPAGGPGGYGQPPVPPYGGGPPPYGPPPPPGGGNSGAKVAAIVIGAVLAAAVVVGGVILLGGGDGEDDASKAGPDGPSGATTEPDGSDAPQDSDAQPDSGAPAPDFSGGASPSASPGDLVPYVVLDPGECFDHPALSSAVTEVETRSCDSSHDGEVISNDKLTGSFGSEQELRKQVLGLCKADAGERLKSIPPDGKNYYYYAIYPSLNTYEVRGSDTISCSLTLSNSLDGRKLTKPLPG